jgi:hypothetical protein
MRITHVVVMVSTLVWGLTVPEAVHARGPGGVPSEEQQQQFITAIEQAQDRLQLTPDQLVQVQEVLEESAEKRKAVFEQHAISPGAELSGREKLSLARDLRPIQKENDEKLQAILDDDQWKEFEAMRNEFREELKERMQTR